MMTIITGLSYKVMMRDFLFNSLYITENCLKKQIDSDKLILTSEGHVKENGEPIRVATLLYST